MIKLHWVTCTSILSLFSKFCLSNGFRNVLTVRVYATSSISLLSHNARAILRRIEKLSRHHHLLISIWRLSLIHEIKINVLAISIRHRCADPATVSKTCISFRLHNLIHIVLLSICIELMLSSITSFNLIHEISIVHSVSHLDVIILRKFTVITGCSEATHFCLVENSLLFSLNVGKHVMDSGIVCRLKHDTVVSCVHFIDT